MIAAGLDSTTMVQRNRTFVLPVEWYKSIQDKVYNANIPTTISDKLSFIGPHGVQRLTSMTVIHSFACRDSERFEALEKAGFRVDAFGDPYWHIVERLGGHYMDVGASAKISQGLVRVFLTEFYTQVPGAKYKISDQNEIGCTVDALYPHWSWLFRWVRTSSRFGHFCNWIRPQYSESG